MTDWKKVQGSQPERPAEVDTTSSASTVYQRRNVERITVENGDGTTTELWQYDEREMTREEYFILSAQKAQATMADIEAAICEADMANAEWQAEIEIALCELDKGGN